ncbi:MAG TPA: ABC transporter permease [Bacteroidales bacterium]|nr:ABC transporter permease [Bacteroidales bacterium]
MFRNYLKTAINTLRQNKGFALINISGLTLGITVSLLILMYVVNELSYEGFQKNRKDIYRIALEWGSEGNTMKFAGSMPALALAVDSQLPEVKAAVRIKKDYSASFKNSENQDIKEPDTYFADPDVFKIFTLPLLEGDAGQALTDPYSVVIAESAARKYFGESDALGRELTYNNTPLKITGVMKDVPENTHLHPDFLISFSTLKALGQSPQRPWNQWGDDLTYVLLSNNVSANTLVPKMDRILKENAGEWLSSRMKFEMQPLSSIHWDNTIRGDIGPKGNKTYVYIFLSAAILILLIACFNFLNLSVTKYLGRVTEIAIRKTAGARRKQLVFQFLTETMVIVIISAMTGIFLFEQFYNGLYTFLGNNNVLTGNHFLILGALVLLIITVVGLTAGIYPALYISRLIPVQIFRKESLSQGGSLSVRKILVMAQFAIAIILLIGTTVIFRQLNYVENSDLGFSKEDVILLNFPGQDDKIKGKYDVLKNELLKNSNIKYLSGAYTLPGVNSQMNIGVSQPGEEADKSVIIQALPADYGFVRSMGLQITEGRDFSKDFSTDQNGSILINQSAVTALNLEQAVGSKLIIPGDNFKDGVTVIGVVKDFHVKSFHEKINPVLIYINPDMYITIAMKISHENTGATLTYVKDVWNTVLPGTPLNYRRLDDAYNSLYGTEQKSGRLLTIFTILAIFISCLGLFGFSSYIVSRRVKEVGIRKVLGAKPSGMLLMLSKQFSVWILVAGIIASPVAWIIAKKWLGSFAFHIRIEWWIFAGAIIAELLIAFLTVSWQTWRASTRNPMEALRYE